MSIKPKNVLAVFAILFFIFNVAHATSLESEDALDTAPALKEQPEEKTNDDMEDLNQVQQEVTLEDEAKDLESPEINTQPSSDQDENKRKIRIPCYCWIGWVKKKSRKYKNFGRIRKFRVFELKKQSKCSASCSKKCAPWLKKKKFLCKKIGKKYHYKWHKVGCFSQVGSWDLPSNLWDFDGSPHGLCCKKVWISCKSAYGAGFQYHSALKLCVKIISTVPIPGQGSNGDKTPPFCGYGNKVYICLKRKFITKPVVCW